MNFDRFDQVTHCVSFITNGRLHTGLEKAFGVTELTILLNKYMLAKLILLEAYEKGHSQEASLLA